MKFVYILEDDLKFKKEIILAIHSYDPKIQIRVFGGLEEFISWLKQMVLHGPSSIVQGGTLPEGLPQDPIEPSQQHELIAIISKIEFLGIKEIPLLKKTRDLFIKRKVCSEAQPTSFVLTTFEEASLVIKKLEDPIISNVIYKPFDQLILRQHLIFAIEGHAIPSTYVIAHQKSDSEIEILKDVNLKFISEVGFVTESPAQIESGIVAKYYGSAFSAEKEGSLLGRLINCRPNPDEPNSFFCEFTFYGTSLVQTSAIRRKIRTQNNDAEYVWIDKRKNSHTLNKSQGQKLNFVVIDSDERNCGELADIITRRFAGAAIVQYKKTLEFLKELDPQEAESEDEAQVPGAFSSKSEVNFVFDIAGRQILKCESSIKDSGMYFGQREAEILQQTNWWAQSIGSFQMETWKDWLKNPKKNITLIVRSGDHKYYIKPLSVTKDKKENLLNVQFIELSSTERYEHLLANSKLPEVVDALIVSSLQIKPADGAKWDKILGLLQKRSSGHAPSLNPQIFIMSPDQYSTADLRKISLFATDIFYRPLDRVYFMQKMKLYFSNLKLIGEAVPMSTIENQENIKTANPVKISEISEGSLVMTYHRAIELGAFREFVLWEPYQVGIPPLEGICNYVSGPDKKGFYQNHFVFFAITAHYLKQLRILIRENYVESKDANLT